MTVTPNPALKKLGFGPEDRVLILHADDIGMCHATLGAYADLVDFGLMSSAATMVPCPWFLAAAEYCRDHPQVDMGVHLTLNSEWRVYRWKPLSTSDPATGLIDDQGYFHYRQGPIVEHAQVDAVNVELRAQLERGAAEGIAVTHIDTHMGTAGYPKFLEGYVDLALERRVMPRLFRGGHQGWMRRAMDERIAAQSAQLMQELEERGVPLFDHTTSLPLNDPRDNVNLAKQRLEALPLGLSLFIFHPAHDSEELRAITPDWQSRVANYRTFTSPELRDFVKDRGIHVIGYRPLQELMPAA